MNYRHPELQRLLNNLNNASQNRQNNAANTGNNRFPESDTLSQNTTTPATTSSQHSVNSQGPPEHQSRPMTPSAQALPDASSITTWPAAIKYVTKHIITDEKATTRIKHLIKQQQQHEDQWWSQREAIVTKHQGRAGSNSKVADILKELGGLAVPMAKVDEAADKNELDMFDKKVYRSLVQMATDCDAQLRKLGVPFYAIKHDLILTGKSADKDVTTEGKLDKGELRDLQKRMLHHLEDLLVDD